MGYISLLLYTLILKVNTDDGNCKCLAAGTVMVIHRHSTFHCQLNMAAHRLVPGSWQ